MKATHALPLVTTLALLAACDGSSSGNTASPVQAPGAPASAATRALEAGAAALQRMPPVQALNTYLDGFHFYSGHMQAQMEAHHYCGVLNEDVIQCVIYDGNVRDAKLMGVEYIVSQRLFQDLPAQEKQLWHSHVHEVKSGQLILPGVPQAAEEALMRKLVSTYGKTWHTWHTDRDKPLPLGVPQLMMGATADGQIDERRVADRDRRFEVDSARKRAERADIPTPPIDPGADAWQKGPAYQIDDPAGSHHESAPAR